MREPLAQAMPITSRIAFQKTIEVKKPKAETHRDFCLYCGTINHIPQAIYKPVN